MIELKMKILYLGILFFIFLISIYMISKNPTKSVICSQENDVIICKNLALVNRRCIIISEYNEIEKDIKGLSEIRIEKELLKEWYCL